MTSTSTYDRTLITKNYLHSVIDCIENNGYDLKDFEISTERVQSYTKGKLNPKSIIYVYRISSEIEKNYVLEGGISFSDKLCEDLGSQVFDNPYIE